MSCSPFDLRDYLLHELADPQQREVASHIRNCSACREEFERLRLTQTALFSLRDEEIPQRIAFVSDPVFEPSRAQRWWSGFWQSGARLGFAGAAMLSAALLLTTFAHTVDVDRRIQRAVSASEARQTQKTTQLVHDLVQRVDSEHNLRVAAETDAEYARKQAYAEALKIGDYRTPGVQLGESQ